jgi:hypothetical protein
MKLFHSVLISVDEHYEVFSALPGLFSRFVVTHCSGVCIVVVEVVEYCEVSLFSPLSGLFSGFVVTLCVSCVPLLHDEILYLILGDCPAWY